MDFTWTWLDPEDVLTWLRVQTGTTTPEDNAAASRVCADVELFVQRCRPEFMEALDEVPPATVYMPDAETYQGAVMYAARQLRRRNSPNGIETFGEGGAAFGPRFDFDVERALRVGAYNRPGVG